MRIIYNEDLNKRIIPYVDKLIKNKKKLDKETAVLFDVFIQYWGTNMPGCFILT